MSQNFMTVPAFDGMNYGYLKARMRFFLKSIDFLKVVEIGWTKLEETTLKLVDEKKKKKMHNLLIIKPSMLYVKLFHCLNSQEFQTIKPLRSMTNHRNNI
jgi:hypothetical protein